ncbi:hypothetical protein GCM10025861_17150 [Methanobacterium petrolearium]|nr:hypothetical protein GCM10025861_17150 [Methanobacterium petrolearium]
MSIVELTELLTRGTVIVANIISITTTMSKYSADACPLSSISITVIITIIYDRAFI